MPATAPCGWSCSFVITHGQQLTPDHFNQNARAAKIITLSISQSAAAGPLLLRQRELAASRSDFEDKWGWFIQLLCPDDKMGAT